MADLGFNEKYGKIVLVILVLVIISFALWQKKEQLQKVFSAAQTNLPGSLHVNQLNLDLTASVSSCLNIRINDPIELDFLSKEEVYALRKKYVNRHPYLINGSYLPSEQLFGGIVSGKPWWGLEGVFCKGDGRRSIDGFSEETRFWANPFLLLGLDECKAFRMGGRPCFAVYPKPVSLSWCASERKAVVTYDMSQFLRQKEEVFGQAAGITLFVENYNARDFGFSFVYAAPDLSKKVSDADGGRILKEPCALTSFIHLGQSCGYPGGCNNASPYQPQLYIRVDSLPATLYCKLWYKAPKDSGQPADFTYIIEFE